MIDHATADLATDKVQMSSNTGHRYRYRAVIPPQAHKHGRPPRERDCKHRARTDLIDGFDRYIRARSFVEVNPGAGATHEGAIALWIVWASRLGEPGNTTAPDGSEWRIDTRWEAL
ncbi:MAG: hypothetical protein ABSG43_17145 [Solirubrobacteraceae bacterium]|jgi:hypothetical protein